MDHLFSNLHTSTQSGTGSSVQTREFGHIKSKTEIETKKRSSDTRLCGDLTVRNRVLGDPVMLYSGDWKFPLVKGFTSPFHLKKKPP